MGIGERTGVAWDFGQGRSGLVMGTGQAGHRYWGPDRCGVGFWAGQVRPGNGDRTGVE